ncbi:MAG: transposase [Pseudanabaenales cyanobacterium]|nr:transposase [Pseudanabaenales cyanobacterium]
MTSVYASELTASQLELLNSLLPAPKPTGRPRTVNLTWVLQAIFYVLTTGRPWYLLPKDYPPQ